MTREEKCRKIFEKLLNAPFPSAHPKWLIDYKGKRLELDGYNPDLKIAFEYQGEQHYEKVKDFNYKSPKNTQINDSIKKELCEKKGVILIVIPYWKDDIEEFIVQELKKQWKEEEK